MKSSKNGAHISIRQSFIFEIEDNMKKQKNAPQILPREEWPYEVPENWVWTRLLSGGAECLDKYRQPVNAAERKNREGNIPYYGATGQVGWIDTYLTDEQLVLLGEDGAPFLDAEKNKAYIIEGPAWVNNHAHILRSLYGNIGNLFLLHYLNQFDYVNYVSGTTRLKLTQAKMNEMPFPLPPLPEQQRIVARIESLFAKLDAATEKIRATIDAFPTRKAALLHKAFTGELTKKWREEHGVGMESWKKCKLGDIFDLKAGKNLNAKEIHKDQTSMYPYPCFGGNGIRGYVKDFNHEGDFPIIGRQGALCGNINLACGRFYATEHAVVVKFHQDMIVSFATHYLSFLNLNQYATATAQPGLAVSKIVNLSIQYVPFDEQQEIVRRLDAILAREQTAKETAERLLETISLTKKSILARAFRGLLGTNDPKEASAEGLLKGEAP